MDLNSQILSYMKRILVFFLYLIIINFVVIFNKTTLCCQVNARLITDLMFRKVTL